MQYNKFYWVPQCDCIAYNRSICQATDRHGDGHVGDGGTFLSVTRAFDMAISVLTRDDKSETAYRTVGVPVVGWAILVELLLVGQLLFAVLRFLQWVNFFSFLLRVLRLVVIEFPKFVYRMLKKMRPEEEIVPEISLVAV